jgi:Domain of unknown function (DUF1906)
MRIRPRADRLISALANSTGLERGIYEIPAPRYRSKKTLMGFAQSLLSALGDDIENVSSGFHGLPESSRPRSSLVPAQIRKHFSCSVDPVRDFSTGDIIDFGSSEFMRLPTRSASTPRRKAWIITTVVSSLAVISAICGIAFHVTAVNKREIPPASGLAPFSYRGLALETCWAPTAATMSAWLASPYRAIVVYIGGPNRGCIQPNLTASWLSEVEKMGWTVIPEYGGLQATCMLGGSTSPINPKKATEQGKAIAVDAAARARALGFPAGTPIIYDMEAYSGCGSQVVDILSSWDRELHIQDYRAGVYESFSNVGDLVKARTTMTEPDVIDYADWDGNATTKSSYIPTTIWGPHQRIHQYRGGQNETWGGAKLNIDSNSVDISLR